MATTIYRQQDFPRYVPGIMATISLQVFLLFLLGGMTLHFWYENKRAKRREDRSLVFAELSECGELADKPLKEGLEEGVGRDLRSVLQPKDVACSTHTGELDFFLGWVALRRVTVQLWWNISSVDAHRHSALGTRVFAKWV
ncbi:uncharacterized protein BT62DRAFT_1008798 [Guyanagaster necrorhizus]|uniref:Uncharacterized protein n=1 Tax=Guyanagaster necrorhizus TaxID=856835 RepID=A0A9P8AQ83_9AGAR|nr:uncharacterized protein BT62DRAFT_1008798 [Guyanagaster necrorhizus MCA 3950]KAG7443735.1 hypothetical protein BT62DRAFT_1008798 [Guyanagaster necrorhizus MCA 3950]